MLTLLTAAAILAATPAALRWVRRKGAQRRTVNMRTTVIVERPITEVFDFCRDFENFPAIVDVLLSVEDTQDGRSRWSVRSPTGKTIGWDAVVTKYVPNSVIAWESVADSPVDARGLMRFSVLGADATRVDISLTYRPHHTDVADAIRSLVHPTNTKRLRAELVRASRELGVTTNRAELADMPPSGEGEPIRPRASDLPADEAPAGAP